MSAGTRDCAPTPTPPSPTIAPDPPTRSPVELETRSADARSSGLQTPEDAAFALEIYWNARAKGPLSERLALFRSLYTHNEAMLEMWRGVLESRAIFDRTLQDAGIATFREQQFQQFLMEISADPAGTEPELVKFRQSYKDDSISKSFAQALYKTLGTSFAATMRQRVREALGSMRGPQVSTAAYNLIASEAMNPFAKHDKEFDRIVRLAFYGEAKALVLETKNADLAVGLLRSVGTAMASRYDDPNVIDENVEFSKEIRDVVRGIPMVDQLGITDAVSDVQGAAIVMGNHRNTLHDVQFKYITSVMALKAGFERVGDQWVAYRTQALRNRIEEIDKAREVLGRAINIGWSLCSKAEVAFPLVLAGTLIDIAFEAEEEYYKKDLADLETKLRATLARKLSSGLGNLYAAVSDDAKRIAANDLPIIEEMPSVTKIEETFATTIANELSKVKT